MRTRHTPLLLALLLAFPLPAVAQEVILRDVLTIGGQPYLRTQLKADAANVSGVGHGIEAADGECITVTIDDQDRLFVHKFDRWLRRLGDPIDGGMVPPPGTYAGSTLWRGGFVWIMLYDDLVLSVRRIDPRRESPNLDFVAISNIFWEGRFGLDARDGVLFVVISGNETDGDEFGVFGRILTYDGTPLTPRLRLAVGPITPQYSGNPALTTEGAAVVFRRVPPGRYIRNVYSGEWTMSPWQFLGDVQVGLWRALPDGNLVLWRIDQVANRVSLQKAAFNGTFIGDPVPLDILPSGEHFPVNAHAEMGVAAARNGVATYQLFDNQWHPKHAQTALAIGATLPVHRIADADYSDDGTLWISWYATTSAFQTFEDYLTAITPLTPGDLDGDGRLTNFDIDPFVLALTNREAYQAAFPHIPPEAIDILGDLNGDGVLTNFDIDPFVEALVNGP
ncbi:MAG: hypothetical protein HRU75_01990 [Planctomycetia bacterium]|nr:MAG: hypothetical protein HRU75_01990 [Planctomycetia bacterium]